MNEADLRSSPKEREKEHKIDLAKEIYLSLEAFLLKKLQPLELDELWRFLPYSEKVSFLSVIIQALHPSHLIHFLEETGSDESFIPRPSSIEQEEATNLGAMGILRAVARGKISTDEIQKAGRIACIAFDSRINKGFLGLKEGQIIQVNSERYQATVDLALLLSQGSDLVDLSWEEGGRDPLEAMQEQLNTKTINLKKQYHASQED